ncbi:hypothetical protein [Sagittula salina]|uniref:Uncharacterized protein n=1 Tax=Sagittula salina TaxID=2820268 RepID=A0A940MN25_9RHOB|nr:hypothetical protein [Sagittula salina]MBP0482745.1 hypothetical protein [Sagittula salina]
MLHAQPPDSTARTLVSGADRAPVGQLGSSVVAFMRKAGFETGYGTQEAGYVDRIVVPGSAFAALDRTPELLIDALSDFRDVLGSAGRFPPAAMPPLLHRACTVRAYAADVREAGHAGVLRNLAAEDLPARALSDLVTALRAMGAERYAVIAGALRPWLNGPGLNGPGLNGHGLNGRGKAPDLARLDHAFTLLDRRAPLLLALARWVAARPEVSVVDDAACTDTVQRLCEGNRDRLRRAMELRLAGVTEVLSDDMRLGIGLACGRLSRPELVLSLGRESARPAAGRGGTLCRVQGLFGARMAALAPGWGMALSRVVEDVQGRVTPFARPTIDVSEPEIRAAAALIRRLKVAAALCCLTDRVGRDGSLVPTVLIDGPVARADRLNLVMLEGDAVFVLEAGPEGARLSRMGEEERAVTVARARLDAFAQCYAAWSRP